MAWLEAWSNEGKSPAEALEIFEKLPVVAPSEMIGDWRGNELPTGHPLDGLLEAYGWWGKRFIDADMVDPLLFEHGDRVVAVDPARIPIRLALTLPRIARTDAAVGMFRAALPLLGTRWAKARLRTVEWRGQSSAAMIYDDLPIIDHFRRVDDGRALGLMDLRFTAQPFFFQLTRAT